ncbi:MAG: protein-disulfide reductase DsbD domain-containing protein [Devosiaceae bacterium]
MTLKAAFSWYAEKMETPPYLASLAWKGQQKVSKFALAASFGTALLVPLPATAQQSVTLEGATISLMSAPVMANALLADVVPLESHQQLLFVSIDLAPGWKTYWRLPGRFGLAPDFQWEASENLSDVEILFPKPHLFEEGGGHSIGYDQPVLWPIVVSIGDELLGGQLDLEIGLGLCEALCLPEQVSLGVDLSAQELLPTPSLADVLALSQALPTTHSTLKDASTVLSHIDEVEGGIRFIVAENAQHHRLVLPDADDAFQINWDRVDPMVLITAVPENGPPIAYTLTPTN